MSCGSSRGRKGWRGERMRSRDRSDLLRNPFTKAQH